MLLIAIEKPAPDARLGISLEVDGDGRVLVSRVSRSGLFGRTKLAAGMEIVMVNDVICEGISEVSQALQQAPAGPVTVQVIAPETVAPLPPKQKQQSSKTTTQGGASLPPSRTASREDSIPLDEVAPGAVEILLDPERAPPPFPLAKKSSKKEHKHRKKDKPLSAVAVEDAAAGKITTIIVPHVPRLGLRLQQCADRRHVLIRRIDADSVFYETDLRVGNKILAVNNYDCVGLNVEQVSQLFRQPPRADGVLTLLVQDYGEAATPAALQEAQPNVPPAQDLKERFQRYKSAKSSQQKNKPAIIRAVVRKQTPRQPTGVRLKETPDRRHVRIDRIQPNSLFSETKLRVGMIVVAINNVDVEGFTVQQVAQLVRETQGDLTIQAKEAS